MVDGRREGGARALRLTRATLDSVAARAGVSRQTVSNVINLPHLVRDETASKVTAAIAELGYRPHRAARQLRTRRSRILGLRVETSAGDKIFDRFLHALTEAAGVLDYRIMLYTARDDASEIAVYHELFDQFDLDGFVLTATHPGDQRTSYLTKAGIPCVTFGRDEDQHHSWVDVDGAAGTREATRHLLDSGYRHIEFLGWPDGSLAGDDRVRGWREEMRSAQLPAGEPERCANDLTESRRAARRLLDRTHPDAVVCASDILALGIITELSARGQTPGQDVAVTGFDDTELAQVTGLSSLSQPLTEVARHCARLVTAAIEGRSAANESEQILLPPHLMIRQSSGRGAP